MTQEDIRRARQILQNNGIEQLDKDDYFFKSIIKSMNDYQQQPIPQDINKWIEEFGEKSIREIYTVNGHRALWEEMAYCLCQLLLPELQQLREKLETTELIAKGNQNSYDAAKGRIEQQKSQIDTFTKTLVEYAEQIVKQEAERKEQAAEIESLKQENEKLHKALVLELNSPQDYWKQRCEAAEAIIEGNEVWGNVIEWETWQTLKQQTHG